MNANVTITAPNGKTFNQNQVRILIRNNQRWTERAIVAIYEYQESVEKHRDTTIFANGVGFNQPDARKMSYYARWILSGKHLTGRHLEDAQRRIEKYAGQLMRIGLGVNGN